MEQKNPAENIIGLLGGLTKTASLLSTEEKRVAVSTVQGWKDRGKIPQEWWMQLISVGAEAGVAIDLTMFFGQTETAA